MRLAPPTTEFLLCGCQPGAEAALRHRAAEALPALRPAAWRRGVVTFRLPPGQAPPRAADLVFACGVFQSLGQVRGDSDAVLAAAAVTLAGRRGFANVHLWHRVPPARGVAAEAAAEIDHRRTLVLAELGLDPATPTRAVPGDLVLDCLVDEADRWWVGPHRADDVTSCWPGGIHPAAHLPLPEGVVSRAWLKLAEAIEVFGIPFVPGQRAVELGASPGGACQRLLEAGLEVVGVDPAPVDARVAGQPRFTQWRMRARDVPLERFRGVTWLVADMNIDPKSTLAALGRVATARQARLEGIVATLKLPDWSRAAELPDWLAAFRGWGYDPRARQLSTAGREVCVVATRRGKIGRSSRKRPPT